MIQMIDGSRKILEPVIVYLGAMFHYVLQISNLAQFEGAVNVIVGLLVALYTFTKILDWGLLKRKSFKARKDDQEEN